MNNKTYVPYVKIDLGKDHYCKRNEQVNKRALECIKALDFILDLNRGIVPHNVINDIINNNQEQFKLEDFIDKIDIDTLTMAGQSFGGASALLALSKRKEFKYVRIKTNLIN